MQKQAKMSIFIPWRKFFHLGVIFRIKITPFLTNMFQVNNLLTIRAAQACNAEKPSIPPRNELIMIYRFFILSTSHKMKAHRENL